MKLKELDFVRAFAIVAVLLIHGTSETFKALSADSASYTLYLTINKLSNFAVPVFIFVSGLVLFYRYIGDWRAGEWLRFYRKRLRSVLIPYIIWTLVYYIFRQLLAHPDSVRFDPLYFLKLIPSSNAEYHLYFIIIILQFYVLFPIWLTLAVRSAWFKRYFVLLAWGAQTLFYVYGHWVQTVPHRAELSLTYAGLFATGAWIGMHYGAVVAWLDRYGGRFSVLTIALGAAYTMYFIVNERRYVFEHTWFETTFNLYGVAAGVSLIWLGRKLAAHRSPLTRLLVSIGLCSYGIYFVHPALLSLYRTYVAEPGGIWGYALYTLGGIALVLALSWLLTLLYKKIEKPFKAAFAPASKKTAQTTSAP